MGCYSAKPESIAADLIAGWRRLRRWESAVGLTKLPRAAWRCAPGHSHPLRPAPRTLDDPPVFEVQLGAGASQPKHRRAPAPAPPRAAAPRARCSTRRVGRPACRVQLASWQGVVGRDRRWHPVARPTSSSAPASWWGLRRRARRPPVRQSRFGPPPRWPA